MPPPPMPPPPIEPPAATELSSRSELGRRAETERGMSANGPLTLGSAVSETLSLGSTEGVAFDEADDALHAASQPNIHAAHERAQLAASARRACPTIIAYWVIGSAQRLARRG